jgi:Domain of unknown function (DUF4157)
VYQRIQKSSSWNLPIQEKNAQVRPPNLTSQAQQNAHRTPTQEELNNEAFNQTKFEALGLQFKQERGSITPVEQGRLGVLQAKMDDFWAQKLDHASRFDRNLTNIPAHAPGQPQPNRTGLPDRLKTGIETLSGIAMDDVRVHYNSAQPAQLQALAYTQGTDIHVAPGQERHLPHEAWHVIQQAQGRVKPTMQLKDRVAINGDKALEREADVMGNKALQRAAMDSPSSDGIDLDLISTSDAGATIQRKIGFEFETTDYLPSINEPPLRPAKRKEELHQGSSFKLEGDDSTGGTSPSIEFVTSAYAISPQGMNNCKASFKEINAILKRIEKFEKGDVITGPQHQLSNQSVELTRKEDHKASFKMQITQGVSLEDLPTVMKYFGTNVPGETKKEAKDRKQSRRLMADSPSTELLGIAPSLAQKAIDRLKTHGETLGIEKSDITHFKDSQPRLLGFLSQIMMYVKALTIPDGQFQKYKMPFLGRVEFSALFDELSPDHRRILAQDGANALTDAVVYAANSVTLWPTDKDFASGSPLLRTAHIITGDNITTPKAKLPVMQSLTIQHWLRGITKGIDWLSASYMNIWLTHLESSLSDVERTKRTDLLESFNMLGDDIGDATDAADRPDTSGLSVLENRAIAPSGRFMQIKHVESAAFANLEFLLNMKKNAGAPGKFPKVEVPKH